MRPLRLLLIMYNRKTAVLRSRAGLDTPLSACDSVNKGFYESETSSEAKLKQTNIHEHIFFLRRPTFRAVFCFVQNFKDRCQLVNLSTCLLVNSFKFDDAKLGTKKTLQNTWNVLGMIWERFGNDLGRPPKKLPHFP